MKRPLFLQVTIGLLLLMGSAIGQNATTYTVGAGVWMPGYALVYTGSLDDMEDYELGSGTYFGPYLAVNHGRWNFGASLLVGTLSPDDKEMLWEGYEAKRTDLNLTVGYRVISTSSVSGNLFAGLKYVKETATSDNWLWSVYTVDTWEFIQWYDEYDATSSGTLYGAGASLVVPFGTSSFYAYGSMAYLMGSMELENNLGPTEYNPEGYSSWDESYDLHLFALTAGIGYRFPDGIGLNLGYRGDLFGQDDADEADYSQRLSGIVLNASYTF